ncbi:MAG: hypothetical protein JKY98_09990 [Gammaproteobacteria bacterium]|nr:hypothetical protein [Gammaproteobacteria bacterium]
MNRFLCSIPQPGKRLLLLTACLSSLGGMPALAQQAGTDSAPTFSRDIAPILQRACQQCHNPDGIGPMPLLTYDQVRPFAALIQDRVSKRMMPPWHVDPDVGIQRFKNDMSLSHEEIALISQWVDGGAPQGNPADMPPALELPSGGAWRLEKSMGPPDMIVKSTPYDVVANGQDQWWTPRIKFEGLDTERWLRAAEFKPSFPLGKKVVHHGHATLIPEGESKRYVSLARYGVGKSWEMFPEGTGLRVPPKGEVRWSLHYFPAGTDVADNVVEVGLWFYPEDTIPEFESKGEVMFRVDGLNGGTRAQDLVIPPNSYKALQGSHVLQSPAVIHSYRPHMHMRGKVMTMEAIYPDGHKKVLSQVNNYNHNWQLTYIFEDDARPLLPKGTVLQFTSFYDNTSDNPLNPDPNQWVVFGQRGVDEMSHAWLGITYLNEEQYAQAVKERRVAEEVLGSGGTP